MDHSIKLNRASKLSPWGRYPRTWSAIISSMPGSMISKLSAKEIAEVVEAWQANRGAAKSEAVREYAQHQGITGDPWAARVAQQ